MPDVIISTQVLKELANTLNRKFSLDWKSIKTTLDEIESNFEIQTNTSDAIKSACDISERYHFSFYDSLIITAALESKCNILYSEDMQHGQIIGNTLVITNPFI